MRVDWCSSKLQRAVRASKTTSAAANRDSGQQRRLSDVSSPWHGLQEGVEPVDPLRHMHVGPLRSWRPQEQRDPNPQPPSSPPAWPSPPAPAEAEAEPFEEDAESFRLCLENMFPDVPCVSQAAPWELEQPDDEALQQL